MSACLWVLWQHTDGPVTVNTLFFFCAGGWRMCRYTSSYSWPKSCLWWVRVPYPRSYPKRSVSGCVGVIIHIVSYESQWSMCSLSARLCLSAKWAWWVFQQGTISTTELWITRVAIYSLSRPSSLADNKSGVGTQLEAQKITLHGLIKTYHAKGGKNLEAWAYSHSPTHCWQH